MEENPIDARIGSSSLQQEEVSPGEDPNKRIRQARDGGSREGADIGPLLEGVKSALEKQTWLMRQMWATHTAMESELRLLRQGMEFYKNTYGEYFLSILF